MASPTDQMVSGPLSFFSTLPTFTVCFHFPSCPPKGLVCYKSISHSYLCLPFARISLPNQFAVRPADQAHFVAKAFLEPCEL